MQSVRSKKTIHISKYNTFKNRRTLNRGTMLRSAISHQEVLMALQ